MIFTRIKIMCKEKLTSLMAEKGDTYIGNM